jgi:AraC-like DNA-binding protein
MFDLTLERLLLFIASYLAFYYALVISIKKDKHISDVYLTIWLIGMSAYIAVIGMGWQSLDICLSFLFYVFLYFYIDSITRASVFNPRYLLHLLPFAALLFVYLFKRDFFDAHLTVFMCLQFSLCTVYIYWIRKVIVSYKQLVNMNYSTSDRADLSWIGLLIYCTGFSYLAGMIGYLCHLAFGTEMRPLVFDLILFLFINLLGLRGIKQNTIFVIHLSDDMIIQQEDKTVIGEDAGNKADSYLNYGLKKQEAQVLAERLKEYMDTRKPYKDADLTLRDLAVCMDVYPHYVTQVLSTVFNQNFYDFVNTYRVNEAKILLRDTGKSAKVSILSIAYDCGFNSKSSFNRIFKQKTNMTPSEYRDGETND